MSTAEGIPSGAEARMAELIDEMDEVEVLARLDEERLPGAPVEIERLRAELKVERASNPRHARARMPDPSWFDQDYWS